MLGTATLAFALLFAAISLANHKDRDIRQRDISAFGTSFVATSGHLSMHRQKNGTLNRPVRDAFQTP
uniref:Putative secreted protein n=1 Tax=Ixodes scapularis TaxID=6945 RepID=A0A4D5RX79_IXOSC